MKVLVLTISMVAQINWLVLGLRTYLVTYGAGAGGSAALQWLQSRYGTVAALDSSWNIRAASWQDVAAQLSSPGLNQTAFAADDADWLGVVADRYFNITTSAIRAHDTNHMISGVRFAVNSPQIVRAAGKYCDLIDQHDYSDLPNVAWLAQIYNITGKPVVLGEFSFTAADSNMPNDHGARANNPAPTQTQRARLYAAYAQLLVTQPFVIGYGWWNWVDEPSTGRWPDGEDSNYGLVTLADDVYSILTNRMTQVHANAAQWHTQGWAPCDTPSSNTTLVPLNHYFSASRVDHFVTTTDCFECFDDYAFLGVVGYVYASCVPGAVPLATWWNELAQDNALVTAAPHMDGYGFVRIEGYALPPQALTMMMTTTTTPALLPLASTLLEAPKLDYWAAAGAAQIQNATRSGYANLGAVAAIFATNQ